MHNVKKTPASEAHAISEERRRKDKMALFLETRDKIFQKRNRGEFDAEILALTGALLAKNPDIYSFWGIRRKTLNLMKEKFEAESVEDCKEKMIKLYDDELKLTKEALLSNPKSYGAWYHRYICFKLHLNPDLTKELELCELALSVDGRNFHCWDHRRSVARLAQLTDSDELTFSDKLIARNPSNYSAWHYRATLLPRIRPDTTKNDIPYRMPISEDCLEEEFQKAQNVVCINSEDLTAWTYSRWLCESTCAWDSEPVQIVEARHVNNDIFCVTFNKPVNQTTLAEYILQGTSDSTTFEAARTFQCVESWMINGISPNGKLAVCIQMCSSEPAVESSASIMVTSGSPYINSAYAAKRRQFGKCLRDAPRKCLQNFMDTCEELMKIDDEDAPWEVIALARIKLHLNGATLETVRELARLYARMQALDPQRRAMYAELLSAIERRSIDEAGGDSS